ncbi:MAG TPA: mechanosensitive ion channel domain-containing protein [Burkholderiaceae bacterium]|nr:mechanosensitive ion channel domain-containing protein [Burkholderiaceae bacterium]
MSLPAMLSSSRLYMQDLFDAIQPVWHILLIWALAVLILRFTYKLVRVFKRHVLARLDHTYSPRRIDTLAGVFHQAAAVVVVAVAGMLTLSEIGISITPILATAGVAGIAIGFGAQSLVKDFFTGLFLLIENQVSEGDVIEAAGKSGLVEEVTLRHIRVRDYDGSVHFIPNGVITIVTNKSREFAYAVIDIPAVRHVDLEHIFTLIRKTGKALRDDPLLGPEILADIDIEGVEKLEDALITVRCRLKVMPLQQWRIRREFLARMKSALDPLQGEPEKSPPA